MLGPLLLIALGALFLLNNLSDVYRFSKTWPVIFIVIGLAKVWEYVRRSLGKGES